MAQEPTKSIKKLPQEVELTTELRQEIVFQHYLQRDLQQFET